MKATLLHKSNPLGGQFVPITWIFRGHARVSGVSIASACANEVVPIGRSSNTNKPPHQGVVLTRTCSTNRSNVPMSLSTAKSPCYNFWTEKEKKMFHLYDFIVRKECCLWDEAKILNWTWFWRRPRSKSKIKWSLAGVSEFWRDLVGSMWVVSRLARS